MLMGWTGSWWVQLMSLLPISVGMTLIGLESVDPALIQSSMVMKNGFRTFMKIILPLASPIILASAGFVFILSLTDYSIPSLFQVTTYPLEIFADFSSEADPSRAFLLSVPLLAITIIVLSISQTGIRKAALSPMWRHRHALKVMPEFPDWIVSFQWLALVVLLFQFFVPLFGLSLTSGSIHGIRDSLISARSEIVFTLQTSIMAGFLCIPIAIPIAHEIARVGARAKLWMLVATIPLAVPASLVGIGLIHAWNRPEFSFVYGSAAMPVMASLARFTPIAVIVILAQLKRIDPVLIDASRVIQKNPFKSWLIVKLPILAPGFLAALFLIFAFSAGELGATLMVAPPGRATLTMRIYNYLHYGATENVAGLCLIIVSLAFLGCLFALFAIRAWSRFLPKTD